MANYAFNKDVTAKTIVKPGNFEDLTWTKKTYTSAYNPLISLEEGGT